MELLIDYMRKSIKVEVNTSRNDITNGFNITYRGRNAKTTQAVTAELASKYIDEQTKNTINSTTSAKQFIDQQVNQTKEELDAVDKAAARLHAEERRQPAVGSRFFGGPVVRFA